MYPYLRRSHIEVPLYTTHQYVYLRLTSMARGCRQRWKCCRACSSHDRPHATWLHSRHACSHTRTPKAAKKRRTSDIGTISYIVTHPDALCGATLAAAPVARVQEGPICRQLHLLYVHTVLHHSPPLSWLLLDRRAANEECRRTTRPTFWAASVYIHVFDRRWYAHRFSGARRPRPPINS